MSTRAELLQVQLEGLLQQPPSDARVRRIGEIRAAIAAETPSPVEEPEPEVEEPEPEVETTEAPATERAVVAKPVRKRTGR